MLAKAARLTDSIPSSCFQFHLEPSSCGCPNNIAAAPILNSVRLGFSGPQQSRQVWRSNVSGPSPLFIRKRSPKLVLRNIFSIIFLYLIASIAALATL